MLGTTVSWFTFFASKCSLWSTNIFFLQWFRTCNQKSAFAFAVPIVKAQGPFHAKFQTASRISSIARQFRSLRFSGAIVDEIGKSLAHLRKELLPQLEQSLEVLIHCTASGLFFFDLYIFLFSKRT